MGTLRTTSVLLLAVAFGVLAGCTSTDSDHQLDIVFDVCQPIAVIATDADAPRLTAIDNALALWRERGVVAATLEAAPVEGVPTLEVQFADGSALFHGIYEDELGVVIINNDVTNPDTLTIVVSHELGHAFGLWHVSHDERTSVMNPGNLGTAPTSADGLALTDVWGPCSLAQ
jgi:hypothetical protein